MNKNITFITVAGRKREVIFSTDIDFEFSYVDAMESIVQYIQRKHADIFFDYLYENNYIKEVSKDRSEYTIDYIFKLEDDAVERFKNELLTNLKLNNKKDIEIYFSTYRKFIVRVA